MAGQKDGQATTYAKDNILASTEVMEIISILIDKTARDATNPDGATNLRPGLILTRDAATGKYVHGAAAGGDEDSAVILMHAKAGIDGGDQTAAAFYVATVWEDALIIPTVFDWSACQRLKAMKRV